MIFNRAFFALRCASRTFSSNVESSVIKSTSTGKFVVVDGKFKRVQGDTLATMTEEVTHTGQYFDENDWRRNRFQQRTKMVNPNWAVEMIDEVPPIQVDGRVAYCEGRDGPDGPAALGHPRVYINLDKGKPESCLYCGLRYIKKKHH